MAVTARPIVKLLDVVGHIGDRQLAILVDLLLDPLLLQAAEERLRDIPMRPATRRIGTLLDSLRQ